MRATRGGQPRGRPPVMVQWPAPLDIEPDMEPLDIEPPDIDPDMEPPVMAWVFFLAFILS